MDKVRVGWAEHAAAAVPLLLQVQQEEEEEVVRIYQVIAAVSLQLYSMWCPPRTHCKSTKLGVMVVGKGAGAAGGAARTAGDPANPGGRRRSPPNQRQPAAKH